MIRPYKIQEQEKRIYGIKYQKSYYLWEGKASID